MKFCASICHIKKLCFHSSLERRYFGDVSDRDQQSIPFSLSCHRENSLSEFCSVTRYVKLAGVHRSEPAAARKHHNSGNDVCDVGWTSAVVDSVHHKTELVTNPISDRQPV